MAVAPDPLTMQWEINDLQRDLAAARADAARYRAALEAIAVRSLSPTAPTQTTREIEIREIARAALEAAR